jgi:kynurenine 3-monooxygenase
VKEQIIIIGGGPVGSLLSIFLIKRGYKVKVYEKRPDLRSHAIDTGKSINLALSHRGLTALEKAGLKDEVMKIALPMFGRMVHDIEGKANFQPYSTTGKSIYSISRNELNKIMLAEAEKLGVELAFNHNCTKVDFAVNMVGFRDAQNNYIKVTPEVCLGTDGAFSELRTEMIQHGSMNYSQEFLDYGYKELRIEKSELSQEALHIWPRKNFMLIALPNLDGSFTCTLFLHLKGEESFESLNDARKVNAFFNTYFTDAFKLMPDLAEQFFVNPKGSLVTIKCFPWSKHVGGSQYGLLGDSAHAIVPFYGQGMNCGFEDCTVIDSILEQNQDWKSVLEIFENKRKPNTDAITQMAFENFIEMRDLVADEGFLKKKTFESQYIKDHPDWLTRYEMVTFSDLPYAEVLRMAGENNKLIESLMNG